MSPERQAAHDRIIQLYAAHAFAALDRGNRFESDRWLARIERAERITQEVKT